MVIKLLQQTYQVLEMESLRVHGSVEYLHTETVYQSLGTSGYQKMKVMECRLIPSYICFFSS